MGSGRLLPYVHVFFLNTDLCNNCLLFSLFCYSVGVICLFVTNGRMTVAIDNFATVYNDSITDAADYMELLREVSMQKIFDVIYRAMDICQDCDWLSVKAFVKAVFKNL